MYILSRSSSSPSSCLVTSRLVSFLSIFFNPRPLARRCVFKIGLDENPSASVSDDVYRISYNRPSSRFLPFPFSRGSSKAERKRRPFSLARDRPDFSHPSRPARSDRAIRKRDPLAPYSNICFRSDRFFFSSPTPSPLIRPTISLFPPMEVIERLDILHERQNHRSKREGRSRNCAWQLLIRDLLRFLLSQTRFVSYQNGANKD